MYNIYEYKSYELLETFYVDIMKLYISALDHVVHEPDPEKLHIITT